MENLSPDIFIELNSYLSIKEMIKLCYVSKQLRNTIYQNEKLWFVRLTKDYKLTRDQMQKYISEYDITNFELYKKLQYKLFVFGRNDSGQLGLGHCKDQNTPQEMLSLKNITAVSRGGYHTAVILLDINI